MSETKTSWLLELVDRVTPKMNKIMGGAWGTQDAFARVASSIDDMDDASKKAAQTALNDHRNLTAEISKETEKVKSLSKWLEQLPDDPLHRKPVELDISQAQTKIRRYQEQLDEVNRELDEISKKPDANKAKQNWGQVALAANQAWEITQKVFSSMQGLADIKDLKTNIQRATDMTGNALDETTAKVHRLQKVYKEDGMEIVRAANSYSKQMGMSFDEALMLIEQGFQTGANLNGDMLDQVKEYGSQLKQAGMSGAQGIALMAFAAKEGIFSDKALDAIKEAGTSLRELGEPQVEALKNIGIQVKDLAGKTVFEAVQMISRSMEGATVQAKQMVVSDIFRGAGEDAGLAFIEGLGGVDLNPNNNPAVQEAGAGLKGWLASLESSFATTFGNIAVFGQQFGGVAQIVSAGIPIVQGLTKATWFQNIATKALVVTQGLMNTAFAASPIGWVVAGLAAVTLGVKYAWDKFEGFRAVVYGLWETFKQVFENIKGLFLAVFAPIGDAISAAMDGRWGDAAKAVVQLNPISTAKRTIDYVSGGGLTNGLAEAYAKGDARGRQSFRDDWQAEGSGTMSVAPGITSPASGVPGPPVLDGKIMPKKGSGKAQLGLDIVGDKNGFSSSGGFSGGSSSSRDSGRPVTVHMTVNNRFENVASNMDVKKVAGEIMNEIRRSMNEEGLYNFI